MATCIVSFVDMEGLRHAVEVEAESFYETAVVAVRTFSPGHLLQVAAPLQARRAKQARSRNSQFNPVYRYLEENPFLVAGWSEES
jgi:hypothetical protein